MDTPYKYTDKIFTTVREHYAEQSQYQQLRHYRTPRH